MVERSNRSRPTIYHKGFNRLSPFFMSVKSTMIQAWYDIVMFIQHKLNSEVYEKCHSSGITGRASN